MDEQDVEDIVSGQGHSISLTTPTDDLRQVAVSAGSDAHPFKADASEFLVLTSNTVGRRILRSMGWREGASGVMVSMPSRAPRHDVPTDSNAVQTHKRRLGPERPRELQPVPVTGESARGDTRPKTESDAHEEEWWIERRRALFDAFLTASSGVRRQLKQDRYGLGYCGNRVRETKVPHSIPKKSSGFGIGILEDEDDWDGGVEDASFSLSSVDMDARLQEGQQPTTFIDGANEPTIDAIDASPFLKSHDILLSCPVPHHFTGRYCPTKAERDNEDALRQGSVGGAIATLVDHLKSRLQQVSKDHAGADATDVKTHHDTQELRPLRSSQATPGPLWSRVTEETKATLIGSLLSASRFVKPSDKSSSKYENLFYAKDSVKQRRYDLFCLALEERVPASVMLESQKGLAADKAMAERVEFGEHYRSFRKNFPSTRLRDVDQEDCGSKVRSSRIVYNWKPERLVCKRFQVADPWEKKVFVDNRPPSVKDPVLGVHGQRATPASAAFVDSIVGLLGSVKSSPPPADPPAERASAPSEEVSDAASLYAARPPLSVFKSVFGDNDI